MSKRERDRERERERRDRRGPRGKGGEGSVVINLEENHPVRLPCVSEVVKFERYET